MKSLLPTSLITGGTLTHTDTSITVQYDEIRYAISTGHLNGGLHHIMAVRNQKLTYFIEKEKDLPGGSVANYLSLEFDQIDMPSNFGTALLTTADMKKAIYAREEAEDICIEVIVTAGYEQTATCPGQGHLYVEKDGDFIVNGTINLLVFTNKALTDGAMTRALITITEAKSVALREEKIQTIDGKMIATGTATDGIILTIDTAGEILTDTGSYSLFGDLLGKAVIKAVREIIQREKGLYPSIIE